MRHHPMVFFAALLTIGCGSASDTGKTQKASVGTRPQIDVVLDEDRTFPVGDKRPQQVGELVASAGVSPFQALPYLPAADEFADLGTRRQGGDWAEFLGPTADSISREKGIIAPWPESGLRVVWHKKLGTGYGPIAVSRGRLFVFDRIEDRARLRCLKSETGELLWKFDYATDYRDYYGYNNGPRCAPVVDGDRVYLYGAEGMLHCVSARDGKLVWKVDTVAQFGVVQNFFGVGSAPVVDGDLLLAQVGGSPAGEKLDPDQKNNGTALVAFDKLTGKVKYKVGDDLASYSVPVLATIDKKRWCFLLARNGLLGIDPVAGKTRFTFSWKAKNFESVNASNPVVVGDQVLITETYGPGSALLRVKDDGHEVVWKDDEKARRKSLQCHWNTPIHHNGYVYGSSGRHTQNAELRCIELATGKVMWSEPNLTRASLLMVDGHFVCLGEDGELRLLKVNPKKYEEVSHLVVRYKGKADSTLAEGDLLLEYPCWAAPVLSHGLLYVRGKDRLVCLELIPEKR